MSADLWQRGCERLAAELPEQQFNTWIRPLPAADVADDGAGDAVVTLRVPNRFKLDWIRNQYGNRIQTLLTEIAGKPVRLEIALAQREVERVAANGASSVIAVNARPQSVGQVISNSHVPLSVVPNTASAQARALATNRLNLNLTFDTLVPGRANQMARTAALHVAGAPGQMYNPLDRKSTRLNSS